MGSRTEEIVHAFTEGPPGQRQAILSAMPPTMTRDVAIQLAASDEPSIAIVGLDQITADHVGDRDPDLCLCLATACFQVCRRLYESHGAGPAQVYVNTAGRSAHFVVTALRSVPRYEDILGFLDAALPWLESVGHRSHLTDLMIARVEAHLQLGQTSEALEQLSAVPEELRSQDVRFASLRRRLERAAGGA
ncbi:MAG TPA: tetratricopeptide repeat protein [Kiloniellaceae bacterium]|nr:tetratricopeptide repeat protein [Kiloniellaceae bacterium]